MDDAMDDDLYATVVDVRRQLSTDGSVSETNPLPFSPNAVSIPLPTKEKDEKSDESSSTGGGGIVYYYNLRPTARNGKTCFVTWWDADDSGNYDPALEGKQVKEKKKLRLVRYQNASSEEVAAEILPENKRRIEHSGLASRQRGCAFTLTIPHSVLHSRGLALVKDIPDNWPATHHNILSDEYIAKQVAELHELTKNTPYIFRNRSDNSSKELKESSDDECDDAVKDPLGIEEDLANHPAARGCMACRFLKMPCPLLEDESAWPCRACQEDNCDCELIIPPPKRSTCGHCESKRLRCSYVYENSDPSKPCTHCQSTGIRCVAGPAPNSITERISYDRDYTVPKKVDFQKRRYVTCTACRADKMDCSLHKKTEEPPCLSCIKRGLACTFQAVRRKKKGNRFKFDKNKAKSVKDAEQQLLKSTGRIPENASYIKTSLCHPIIFLDLDQDKCHWCANPAYGILGLGWMDVLVQPSANGLEYHEISGGHHEQNQQTSRICVTCTMSRVRIVGCPEHEMRPLECYASCSSYPPNSLIRSDEMDLDALDVEAAFDRLMARSLLPSDKWCSLCPSLALYQCCTPQETDMWGETVDPNSDDAEGCGLLLCEDCAVVLNEEEDLEAVIDAMANDVEAEYWRMGARADTEFFRKEGLLIGNVCEGVEEMELDG